MLCGVKFCGGCNPRYERGKALEELSEHFANRIKFVHAQEEVTYDVLLIIGGCTNCCASYCQYETRKGNVKLCDGSHISRIIDELEQMLEQQK